MPTWNPDLYLKFGNERAQPAIDLVSAIDIESPKKIIDLGCGSGNSTALLKNRWPNAEITGLDSSLEMIEKARESDSSIDWIVGHIEDLSPNDKYDLIFSNAALQWIENHDRLLPCLVDALTNNGVFAAQVPNNESSPYHQVILRVASNPKWSHKLAAAKNPLTYHSIDYYYELLETQCSSLRLWETEYCHVMDSAESILQWTSGTGLRPYLEALKTEEERNAFKAEALEGYRDAYPVQSNGKVLFPFRRQFILARN